MLLLKLVCVLLSVWFPRKCGKRLGNDKKVFYFMLGLVWLRKFNVRKMRNVEE